MYFFDDSDMAFCESQAAELATANSTLTYILINNTAWSIDRDNNNKIISLNKVEIRRCGPGFLDARTHACLLSALYVGNTDGIKTTSLVCW